MKIIKNKIIPFKGFKAINLFGILFVRGDSEVDSTTVNHELIHTAQMKELLYIFFYLWYVIEWIVRLLHYRNAREAYRNISFEREAYRHGENLMYLKWRSKFNFLNYL